MPLRDRRLAALTKLRIEPTSGTLLFFLGLAILHTWPLAIDPATLSRNDNGDTLLNEWAIAWVARTVPRDPLHLFDANIFYPERRTLAFSEHLFVPAMLGAPLLWLGSSPVLVFNLLLIAGFALTGWTMSLAIERWTGDRLAGLAAGCLMAFNAHTLTRLPHLQAQHVEFLPLALLALDRLFRRARIADALRLAGWSTLQALTSNYLMVFTLAALAASALVRPAEWTRDRARRVAPLLALAAVLVAVALTPFLLPYYRAQQDQGLTRRLDEVAYYSASWRDYLWTAGRLHLATWSHWFSENTTALFPGVVGLLAAGVAIGRRLAFADPRARMFLAIGFAGLLLSFGPALPGYVTLYRLIPLLHGVRAPVRYGYLVIVALAGLAGFGVAYLRRRGTGSRRSTIVAVAIIVAANVEALRAPLPYTIFAGIPRIYDRLAAEPAAVVAEFPFHGKDYIFLNAPYMLYSTRHWRPLLNGYSGFMPASHGRMAELLREFPDARSIATLRAAGVTHVVVHADAFAHWRGPEALKVLSRIRQLRLVADQEGIRIYRLTA